MRCTLYTSKVYASGMLLLLAGFSTLLYLIQSAKPMPWFALTIFVLLLGAGIVSLIASLISTRPALQVDETGIRYHRIYYGQILWEDIVEIERLPLTTKTVKGMHTHVKDGWRPIRIVVKNREKYLAKIPKLLRMGYIAGQAPDCAAILIEFMGLQPRSGEAFECIEHYVLRDGVRNNLKNGRARG